MRRDDDQRDAASVRAANAAPIRNTRGVRRPTAPKARRQRELTEIELADMVVEHFGKTLRFCAPLGGWHAWTGTHWKPDERERARECVKSVARDIATEAAKVLDDVLFKSAKRAASAAGTSAILDVMRSDPRIRFTPDEANRNPALLACENGTIDLRTGTLRDADPADLITRCARGTYSLDARAPRFERFLEEVQKEPEIRAYLARLFGSAAFGVVRDHVLGVLWGTGANGKSVLAEVVMHALGDYAQPGPPSLVVANGSHEPHPADVASCVGARLVVVHETKRGASFDASKVKLLTGGDRLTARHMRENFFSFEPTHTLVMLSNYRPEADATDAALWRRVQLVPFNVVVPEAQRDLTLAESIKRDEVAGVLAWLVRGCLEWQRIGLAPPASVRDETAAYRAAEDSIGAFIDERCTRLPGLCVKAGHLYDAFVGWCKSTGARAVRGNDFATEVRARGFERKENSAGRWYHGLGLRADDDGSER